MPNKRLQTDSRAIVCALRAPLFDSAAAEPSALGRESSPSPKMKPVQPRELERSWERSPEWRGQFDRLRRSRQRLLRGVPTADLDEVFDLLLSFFITAYHLRDWLLRSGKVPQGALDALFRSNDDLWLCADLANIAKHYDLTDPPRREWQISIARKYVGKGRGWFGDDAVLVALSQGRHYDLRDLVASCERTWTAFLTTNDLMQPSALAT